MSHYLHFASINWPDMLLHNSHATCHSHACACMTPHVSARGKDCKHAHGFHTADFCFFGRLRLEMLLLECLPYWQGQWLHASQTGLHTQEVETSWRRGNQQWGCTVVAIALGSHYATTSLPALFAAGLGAQPQWCLLCQNLTPLSCIAMLHLAKPLCCHNQLHVATLRS